MNDKKSAPKDDHSLFLDAMRGVRPLASQHATAVGRTKPAPQAEQRRLDEANALKEMAQADLDYENLEYGDEAFFQRPNVARATMRKMRRGQIAVQAELDLHGHSVAEAKSVLQDFLSRCHSRGITCVRVIHGKGHRSPGKNPVLKPKVASWLSRWDSVIAFCTARPADGGTGALYVLLKSR